MKLKHLKYFTGKAPFDRPPQYGQYSVNDERKIKYFATRPLKLGQKVSGKNQPITGTSCLQELYTLFACLKDGEFDESTCTKEIQTFKKCSKASNERIQQIRTDQRQGTLVPGTRLLSSEQTAALLKMFPS